MVVAILCNNGCIYGGGSEADGDIPSIGIDMV